MPGLLVGFFILIGAGGASALWGPPHAWSRVDAIAKSGGKSSPCTTKNGAAPKPAFCYDAWSSAPWTTVAQVDGKCRVVYFAVVRGGGRTRLRVGGVEQNLDSGWSFPSTIPVDHRQVVPFVWVDPVSKMVLAEKELSVNCVHDPGRPDYGELYNSDGTLK